MKCRVPLKHFFALSLIFEVHSQSSYVKKFARTVRFYWYILLSSMIMIQYYTYLSEKIQCRVQINLQSDAKKVIGKQFISAHIQINICKSIATGSVDSYFTSILNHCIPTQERIGKGGRQGCFPPEPY